MIASDDYSTWETMLQESQDRGMKKEKAIELIPKGRPNLN
jgi:hypothetical protein